MEVEHDQQASVEPNTQSEKIRVKTVCVEKQAKMMDLYNIRRQTRHVCQDRKKLICSAAISSQFRDEINILQDRVFPNLQDIGNILHEFFDSHNSLSLLP